MTRKALGRGLSALLREVETSTTGLEQIPVALVDPNPYQPRREFPESSLKELADSIASSGLVQPILVRRAASRYQLVVGERRWRAARLAGLETVPAVVRDLADEQALELALTENLLREDLNPLEVARAFEALQEKFHLRQEEIAERVGLDRSTVTNTLRLLRLPAPVQEMLTRSEISHGHARALLGLETEAAMTQLAKLIVKQGLSVRQAENLVAGKKPKPATKEPAKPDANMRLAIHEMERALGTRVKIAGNEKRGRIEISYFSAEDLNRIYERIVKA